MAVDGKFGTPVLINGERQGGRLALLSSLASWAVIAACFCYAATMLYGIAAGFALPPAAIFLLVPFNLSRIDQFLPVAVVAIAVLGAGCAWLVYLGLLPALPLRQSERALGGMWQWWGLPVIVCLFAFALGAGGWSGHIRYADENYTSIAGLIPYSDASHYFAGSFSQAYLGHWNVVGSHRPLAQAFRDVIVFAAQYSYVATLLIQLAIVAVAAYVAAWSVARWRGIWVGLAFFGMIYALGRPMLFTTLTEPLGLIFSLVSLVLFIEAFRRRSLPHALFALAALTAALLMRMGSLFTIPALVLWIAYAFGTTSRERWRVGAAACGAVAIVFLFSVALGYAYGSNETISGANFAWTFCGLSLGTDWANCQATYASQLGALPEDGAKARFLVGQSLENIAQQPGIFLHRLLENATELFTSVPSRVARYYGGEVWVLAVASVIAALLCVPGLVLIWRRAPGTERLFWIATVASVVLSASIIFADDGWRVLYVTHVYFACIASFAFAAPGVARSERQPPSPARARAPGFWQAGLGAVVVIAALFVVVPLLARVEAARTLAAHLDAPGQTDEQVVLGGRQLSGFLVVADGLARPTAVPALRISEFIRLIDVGRLSADFGPLDDLVTRVPFALVFAIRLDDKGHASYYVAPPTLLERRDVRAWRLKLNTVRREEKWQLTLQPVASAEPVP